MKYELAIFDMDGTILDTLEDLTDSLNVSLNAFGYPSRTIEEVRSFVGNGIHRTIELGVPEGTDPEEIEQVFSYFTPYYQAHCNDKTRPYDGIVSLIETLKEHGIKTAVVSNKADAAVHALCDTFFSGLFDYEIGQKPENKRKPAPDSVNEVLCKLSVDRTNAVYIGDSEVDLATASNAQMDCIAVSWGFRGEAFLKQQGADKIAKTPLDVLLLLADKNPQ